MIAFQPWSLPVLEKLVEPNSDVVIRLRRIEDYVGSHSASKLTKLNFRQVAKLASHWGDIVLGWSKVRHGLKRTVTEQIVEFEHDFEVEGSIRKKSRDQAKIKFDMNPEDKTSLRPWHSS